MNRISVFRRGAAFAACALGAAALTAGCSSSTAKSAGSGGTSPGSTSSAGSSTAEGSGAVTGSGTAPTSAISTAPASPAGGSTSSHAAPTTAPSSAPSHAGNGACTTAEMPSGTWRLVPASEGAGHVAVDIAFQNASGHSCTVTGFPGVSLLASNDRPLPTNVLKDPSYSITTVTVAPGAWVHSEMRFSADMPGPGEPQTGQCEPMTVHALAQLPGDAKWAPVTLDKPTPVCEKGQLQAKPFVSGKSSPTGG